MPWPLAAIGVVALASGIILGFGSKYGVARYWWVLAKLLIDVVLVTLVLLVLTPGVDALGALGRAAAAGERAPEAPGTLLFPPIVSSSAVVVAMALAVFTPWGRLARGDRASSPAPSRRLASTPPNG